MTDAENILIPDISYFCVDLDQHQYTGDLLFDLWSNVWPMTYFSPTFWPLTYIVTVDSHVQHLSTTVTLSLLVLHPLFTLASPSVHPLFTLASISLHPLTYILTVDSHSHTVSVNNCYPLFTRSSPSVHPRFTLCSPFEFQSTQNCSMKLQHVYFVEFSLQRFFLHTNIA